MEVFKRKLIYFVRRLYAKRHRIEPLSLGWKGAAIALSTMAFLLILNQGKFLLDQRSFLDFTIGMFVFIFFVVLISGFITLLLHGVKKIPSRYIWILFSSLIFMLFCFFAPLEVLIPFILLLAVVVSLWGALLYKWLKGSYKNAKKYQKVSVLTCLSILTIGIGAWGYWLIHPGEANTPVVVLKQLKTSNRYDNTLLRNPAKPGNYPIKKLTYGSPNTYREDFNKKKFFDN